ncbi:unnamed protein product [Closterium sp. NIES-65]|nr:unnamed protein product [Closterium sp. NIES-65]
MVTVTPCIGALCPQVGPNAAANGPAYNEAAVNESGEPAAEHGTDDLRACEHKRAQTRADGGDERMQAHQLVASTKCTCGHELVRGCKVAAGTQSVEGEGAQGEGAKGGSCGGCGVQADVLAELLGGGLGKLSAGEVGEAGMKREREIAGRGGEGDGKGESEKGRGMGNAVSLACGIGGGGIVPGVGGKGNVVGKDEERLGKRSEEGKGGGEKKGGAKGKGGREGNGGAEGMGGGVHERVDSPRGDVKRREVRWKGRGVGVGGTSSASRVRGGEASEGRSVGVNLYERATAADFVNRKQIGSGRNAVVYAASCAITGRKVAVKAYVKSALSALDRHRINREVALLMTLNHEHIIQWLGHFEDPQCMYIVQEWAWKGGPVAPPRSNSTHSNPSRTSLYCCPLPPIPSRSSSHEHIIQWLGHFEDAQCVYIVQEWASGGDLFEELRASGGHMGEARTAKHILLPLIAALHHMHTRGVVHRDLKPENLLLTFHGTLKVRDFDLAINMREVRPASRLGALQYMAPEVVCDFGLAINMKEERPASRLGNLQYMAPEVVCDFGLAINMKEERPASRLGTLQYMAPEVVQMARGQRGRGGQGGRGKGEEKRGGAEIPKGTAAAGQGQVVGGAGAVSGMEGKNGTSPMLEGAYDEKVDIWACGVLVYELVMGHPPFEGTSDMHTATNIMHCELVPDALPHGMSPACKDFICKVDMHTATNIMHRELIPDALPHAMSPACKDFICRVSNVAGVGLLSLLSHLASFTCTHTHMHTAINIIHRKLLPDALSHATACSQFFPNFSPLRPQVLCKNPSNRPSLLQMLDHPFVSGHCRGRPLYKEPIGTSRHLPPHSFSSLLSPASTSPFSLHLFSLCLYTHVLVIVTCIRITTSITPSHSDDLPA